MNFTVEFLLTTRRDNPIVMTIDTLTKSSHFFPVCMTHQAPSIDRVYIIKMLILSNIPKEYYLIRDSVFARCS
jgi:hypothetical protein